ncbi:efflux RND transporter permease subunit [Pedobacter nutrimenti]|uniref:HME family heavy-metal exporter n=1 Tax=Pedobacter nutrimenti TaxID=1241337 RepID=A0A318UGP9_9SPHI|nr:efflux RND transporter permease subunit [Pedobacter nutrimenti]PYF74670.1 HME family heavy-metal exporter [Pedobacter nutrimenti]
MLNKLILFSLRNRLFVIAGAALLMIYGIYTVTSLPVDVLPDLNRPRVTIFLEANGMAPEEIEAQVLLPTETALNGSPGVEIVRSVASPGLGLVFVEFDWNTDVYRARQLTAEKLQTVQLPKGITPVMGPISSVMGQFMLIAVTGTKTSPMDVRTLADFTIRRRLMSIKGISQVIPIGGERMQYQVLLSSDKLRQYGLSIEQVDAALNLTNLNTTGGFFNNQGSEVLIRNIARANASSLDDIGNTVVANKNNAPVLLKQIAQVKYGPTLKRGDGSLNGNPAVILSIEKQPNGNTVELTEEIKKAVAEMQLTMPKDVKINTDVFQQKHFIENSLTNVEDALRDGFILVVIILFLFLLNFRTTIITLTAIPLSLIITAIIFKSFGISINTLTLGGLAIAIGELVDDAIVDVENVYRRLKENWASEHPRPLMQVIYEASSEVRNSIVYATIIVVLVFLPLFYLQGIEGKIFAPLGIAYITSIIASLVVSLTVTPALCSYLMGSEKALKHVNLKFWKKKDPKEITEESDNKPYNPDEHDSPLVRFLKRQDTKLLNWGLNHTKIVIGSAIFLIVAAMSIIPFFGTEFLPPFNEGSYTVNLSLPAGTSLEEANKVGAVAEKQMLKVPEVLVTARRTGRAELDEHAEPPSNSEIEVALRDPSEIKRSKEVILADLRERLSTLKGVTVNIGQPISHRLDHLLSGVRAQIAIKVFGNDLAELRGNASKIQDIITKVPGVVDVQIEKQVLVPQLMIRLDRVAIQQYGLQVGKVAEDLEVFYNGKVLSQILDGQKTFDLLLRTDDSTRNNVEAIRNTQISLPNGSLIPLKQIAKIEFENGINSIYHENTQRRIVISANVQGRDLGSTVQELQGKIKTGLQLPQGYYIEYGGQFESQQSASKLIMILSIFSLAGIFLVLYSHFNSSRIVLQIMLNIPLALIGSVVAVILTGGIFSIATMVGFITLTGIASRNGIMMISHYIHLVEHEGEEFSKHMIVRGSLERLVPVLMTALVAALALIPLTMDATAAGKEILYPVATVILGGLISSTMLDMIVTPVVFFRFGKKALDAYINHKNKTNAELNVNH